jgi:hypothetical protein
MSSPNSFLLNSFREADCQTYIKTRKKKLIVVKIKMPQTNIKGTVVGSFCVPKYIMYYLWPTTL